MQFILYTLLPTPTPTPQNGVGVALVEIVSLFKY